MRERGCVSVMLVTDHYRGQPQGEREGVCVCYTITDHYRGEPQGWPSFSSCQQTA